MNYKQLGKSGLRVSEICLGTMTFGREADESASFEIMDYFVEQGGNFFDTANVYTAGASETVLGQWLRARDSRHASVVATKVFGEMGPGPNDRGLSRRHIYSAVEESLKRLQTDYIDLYQIHRWDETSPPEETLSALTSLIDQGKVRYIGASNVRGWQLAQFLYLADLHGLSRFISVQPIFNALNRGIEMEVLPLCHDQGIGVVPYNPLAAGMLTGKYKRGAELPGGTRLEQHEFYYKRYHTDAAFDVIEAFLESASKRGVSPAQLAVAWAVSEPRVTAPIIGARNLEQIKDSLQGLSLSLSPDERLEIPAMPSGKWVGVDPVYGEGA